MKKNTLTTLLYLLGDIIIMCIALTVSAFIDLGTSSVSDFVENLLICLPIIAVVAVLTFLLLGVYKAIWRFAGMYDMFKIVIATTLTYIVLLLVNLFLPDRTLPLSVFVMGGAFSLAIMISERLIIKVYSRGGEGKMLGAETLSGNIMVIGGGHAASILIRDIKDNSAMRNCHAVCAIDDAPEKLGKTVYGVSIVGDRNTIIENAKKYAVDIIIFAIPSCSAEQKREILGICAQTGCKFKTMPAISEMLTDKTTHLLALRSVEPEDLLGRDPIKVDLDSVMKYVEHKVVMVTGGGGSIGSELCRQIMKHNPDKLIIFDIYENSTYDINNELKHKYPKANIVALIGSVRDSARLEEVFAEYRPNIIYHAAAHKHVPLMEDSPYESIKNNVFGTLNTVQAADRYGVERMILISTDKAVNPTNIMGASKRICEMIVQSYNRHSQTEYVAVRFGNVLGSNGSVIPLFKKQIEEGGPVTVTSPDIIRYFMTIPEAVSLVLQAGAFGQGGEIFVLDMGKPMKIVTLAENLIRLSGYEPYVDINIEFIGLRPGEKLYEELLMAEEGMKTTANELIHIGKPIEFNEDELFANLQILREFTPGDDDGLRAFVHQIVPTYTYTRNEKSEAETDMTKTDEEKSDKQQPEKKRLVGHGTK